MMPTPKSDEGWSKVLPNDELQHILARRTERQTNADLMSSLSDDTRHDPINSHYRQEQRERSKIGQYRCVNRGRVLRLDNRCSMVKTSSTGQIAVQP